jgi:hypothetical protein
LGAVFGLLSLPSGKPFLLGPLSQAYNWERAIFVGKKPQLPKPIADLGERQFIGVISLLKRNDESTPRRKLLNLS